MDLAILTEYLSQVILRNVFGQSLHDNLFAMLVICVAF